MAIGTLTIGLLGDVMLGRGVAKTLDSRLPESVWSPELREIARQCDAVVCNLECCVSSGGTPTRRIPGKPFFFRAPPSAVESLTALGVSAVSLANNHALDFEAEALEDSVALLDAAGIATVGAGLGPSAAWRGTVITTPRGRVGLLGMADHPSEYAARPGEWGTAYGELGRVLPTAARTELARLAESADVVIAFPHWGPNMRPSPARWQRRRAADMLAAGATLVVGHSAHVFHGVERHGDRFAAYDLGGALDDYMIDPVLRNDCGLLALWRPGGEPELEFVGLFLGYAETEIARGDSADWIADRLTRASAELGSVIERTSENTFAVKPMP
jgi:poly-gamma-glutamate capsule biosynthesis protein CapA/YwtB (metallophosphatase superfamily)